MPAFAGRTRVQKYKRTQDLRAGYSEVELCSGAPIADPVPRRLVSGESRCFRHQVLVAAA